MSEGHDHDDDAAEAHDDHAFDGEPARELGPGEPQTPAWIPAVGAALFVAAGIFFLVERKDADAAPPPAATAAPQIVATAMKPPATPRPLQAAPNPAPPQGAEAAVNRLSPEQRADLAKRLKEAAAKKGAPAK